jgi:hypothetical protein
MTVSTTERCHGEDAGSTGNPEPRTRHDEKLVTVDEQRRELWPFPIGVGRTRPRLGLERLACKRYLCQVRTGRQDGWEVT